MTGHPDQAGPTYHILGVPLRTGSLYPGSEDDARAYCDVQLLARLHAVGCEALDDGDVAIPSYLPHHTIPRSGTGPDHVSPGTVSASASCRTCNSPGMFPC